MTQAGPSDAGYAAFIRALRSLPGQQREAFILHHGEHLNERFLSVAMDCSVKAAQVHLEAAEKALKAIGGEAFAPMTDRMAKAYHQLTPTEEFIRPEVRALVRRSLWPRRLRRIVRFILVGIILAAAACAAWRFRRVWLGQ